MKKIIKLFIVVVLFVCCLNFNTNIVYAREPKGTDASGGATKSTTTKDNTTMEWRDGFKYADNFTDGNIEWDNDEQKNQFNIANLEKKLKQDSSSIFSFLVAIGTALTVIVGAVLGIQYMVASAEDKAKVKEKMIPYVVGCIVIFGAFSIWYLVVNVLGRLN